MVDYVKLIKTVLTHACVQLDSMDQIVNTVSIIKKIKSLLLLYEVT